MKMESTGGQVSYDDIFKMFTELKDDFKRVETSLGPSLNACHEEISEVKGIVSQQKKQLESLLNTVEELRSENIILRKMLAQAEERANDAEYRRDPRLVKMVGRALDYPVEDIMVDACHRLRTRNGSDRPPGIRNLNSHDLGMTDKPAKVVYVNVSLSAGRRRLLNAARQAKREKGYTYLWIRGGKVLMRKSQGDPVKVLNSMDNISDLNCNEGYRAGGVAVYVQEGHECTGIVALHDMQSADCVQLTFHTGVSDFVLLAVYRLHVMSIHQYIKDIEQKIASLEGRNIIYTGDINCDILSDDINANNYLNLMAGLGLSCLVEEPTSIVGI
ncbi:hypothetical protein J6590_083669 [Homalodisca vitripennis]|nr:hypothetical protein J6590_083669 [Homalodisca vitripennis]